MKFFGDMNIQEYTEQLQRRYNTGISREHSYRGDLQTLLESLLDNILVTNEPKRSDVGAPYYILTKGKIPVGYIEAKDIGGYQPAEKWLKDRRGRELSIEEIQHYQKIIVALVETDRIMGKIDGVLGGELNG